LGRSEAGEREKNGSRNCWLMTDGMVISAMPFRTAVFAILLSFFLPTTAGRLQRLAGWCILDDLIFHLG